MAKDVRKILQDLLVAIEANGSAPAKPTGKAPKGYKGKPEDFQKGWQERFEKGEMKEVNEYFKNIHKNAMAIREEMDQMASSQADIAETAAGMSSAYSSVVDLHKEIEAGIHGQVNGMERQILLREEQARIAENRIAALQREIAELETIYATLEAAGEAEGLAAKRIKNRIELLKNTVVEGKKFTKTLDDANKALKKLEGQLAGILGGLLGINAEAETFLGTLVETYKTAGGMSGVLQAMGSAMLKVSGGPFTGFLRGTGSALQKVIQFTIMAALELDNAQSSFNAATGAGGKYNQMIEDNWRENKEFSMTIEESAAGLTTLREGFAGIMGASDDAIGKLGQFVSQMQVLNISSADAAQLSTTVFKSFKGGVGDVKDITLQFKGLADMMGKNVNEVVGDFNKLMPELGKYGKDSIKIFKRLAYTAQKTGVAIDTLMSAAGQFDTLEGASESVGKLNALLGGPYLNTVQMLNADEEERIQLLKRSMRQSGLSWESLNKFQRQAIANEAGITDMNEALMLFGSGLEAMEAREKAEEAKAAQEEWNKSVTEAKGLAQRFMEQLKQWTPTLMPILKGFRDLLKIATDVLLWFTEQFGQGWGVLLGITSFVVAKGILVSGIGMIGTWLTGVLAPSFVAPTTAANVNAAANMNAAKTLAVLKGSMYAGIGAGVQWLGILGGIALAALGVGKGIQWASQGIAEMATAIGNMQGNTDTFLIALGILAGVLIAAGIGMFFVGQMGMSAAPGIIAFGAGIALIGAGIALAGLGINLMMKGFSDFAKNLQGVAASTLLAFAGFLLALGIFINVAAAVGTIGAVGIALVTVMIVALGYAMSQVAASFEGFGEILTSIGGLSVDTIKDIAGALTGVTDVMADFSAKLSNMDKTKVRIFSESLVNMGSVLDSAVTAAENPAAVEVIKNVSESITAAGAETSAATGPVDRVITAITEFVGLGGGKPAQGRGGRGDVLQGPFNITFQIDGDKVGKIVANYIKNNELIKAEFN